ncbi:MAG: hypothetical protein IJZ39_07275 [Oscillospiraceae bacterium]|nr:hypothetical protein [Oscillospiraceae bacterium]
MLKKPITYTDYDGNKRTENFWFNLDEAEILELMVKYPGGLKAMLEKIVEEEDGAKILAMIKEIIMLAYGEKSLDGKYFEKSEEKSRAFTQTRAYSALIMELYRVPGAAAEFMNKIIPQSTAPAANPGNGPALNVVATQ